MLNFTIIRDFINRGNARSILVKKNIIQMLFLKGGNILIGLMLVPLTLHYVDSETYGVWLALSSMIAWISFFDIGINNGLKNNLTKALALGDYVLCKKLVSTTYAILTMIFIPLMLLLLIIAPMLDWQSILNLPNGQAEGLLTSICIVIAYFCINFILSTINVVLTADQRPADAALRTFIQQLISLIIIFILTRTTEGSLVNLCLGLCFSPLLVIALFNFTLFRGRYKEMAPSLKSVDFKVAPLLLKLGIQFFIIHIAGIIQYQMASFLILRYYGASEVTNYNICNKYFNVLYMVWGILTTPIWAAVTDAITRGDYEWIKNAVIKYLKMFGLFAIGGLSMLAISSYIYDIWIGDSVNITYILSLWVLAYNLVMMFGSIFVLVINGTGQLKIQMIASCISPFVFICTFAVLYASGIGIYSVLIAAILSNFNGLVLAPLQYLSIIKHHV